MKLALGTVQFGLNYGVSNEIGQVGAKEVSSILSAALAYNINTLDCAAAYGTSEQLLGEQQRSQQFSLVTKITALTHSNNCIAPLLKQSLAKLQRKQVDSVLLHNADDIITHPNRIDVFEQLENLKHQGLTNKIGVSVYSLAQLDYIIKHYDIDIVQLPINCFDQRFLQSNYLEKLASKNIKIHSRSVFLQGLLLMEPISIPRYFLPYQQQLQAFEQLAQNLSCSKITLALAIVAQNPLIERIVVGCCTKAQLDEIVASYQQAKSLDLSQVNLAPFASKEQALINPSLWNIND